MVIISKITEGKEITIDKFIYSPESGEKINYIEICKNDTVVTVKKSLESQITNDEEKEILEELTEQGINVFDPNSDFYTDLCFHFKSPIDGKDIPVKDRLELFFPNITLCDEGCNIKGVNLTSWKALCECTLNNLMNNNLFGNNLLVQNSLGEVQDILTKTNIEVLKCYKDIYDIEMYKKNTGMFIIIGFIIVQLICIFIYYYKCTTKIKKYVLAITDKYISTLPPKNNIMDSSIKPNTKLLKSSPPKINNINEKKLIPKKLNRSNNKTKTNNMKKINSNKNIKRSSMKTMNYNISQGAKQNSNDIMNNSSENIQNIKKDNEIMPYDLQDIVTINIKEYIKTDPDNMDYDDAIRLDKRTFCEYYYDRLKTEQILLSTFIKYEVLKPIPTKIILLILNFDLYIVINALFFNENYISDLLHSESNTAVSFINRIIDRIVIITLTGIIINYVVEFFFIEENRIKKILKREKENIIVLKYEIVQIIKNTYTRYNTFVILSSIILLFSLYYIFCFNNVYPCIKDEWLKSSIIIIILMQILPVIICLIDAAIRFISFKCKSERLFRLSSILL